MLVKCPKCGFDQPKDTYCANCGIEMESFRPIKAPLWKRIVKSPLFSLLIFIVLGYGAFQYLKNPSEFSPIKSKTNYAGRLVTENLNRPNTTGSVHSTTEVTTTMTPTPAPTSLNSSPTAAHATPTPELSNTTTETASDSSTLSANFSAKNPPSDLAGIEDSADSTTKPINIDSITGPLELEIRFIEAPNALVQQFLSEASENSSGDSGEMNYAIVKNSTKWLRHRSFTEHDRFTKKVPAVKKKLQWFSGGQEPKTQAPFGLNFQVSIQERHGGHLIGDLFISRSIVEQADDGQYSTQRKEFLTNFETDVGSLIGIVGVMPHAILESKEKDWLQDSLLKVFNSGSYLLGETELLILLQFKGDSK
jgi:hypothetical protein